LRHLIIPPSFSKEQEDVFFLLFTNNPHIPLSSS
jgi:hypothetical protein